MSAAWLRRRDLLIATGLLMQRALCDFAGRYARGDLSEQFRFDCIVQSLIVRAVTGSDRKLDQFSREK